MKKDTKQRLFEVMGRLDPSFILNETSDDEYDNKIRCIYSNLQKEEKKHYKLSGGKDGLWVDIRPELRRIDYYFKHGYFDADGEEIKNRMDDFLKGLDYSNSHTYEKGEQVRRLPTSTRGWKNSEMPVYKAMGNKTLFRGVSLLDWHRIKNQGFIDSDMRGAIVETEGINLGQKPTTAMYYLPHNDKGVILAISPKNLDLYMLNDEYIRVFEPIPIKNVIKVSEIFVKDEIGMVISNNIDKNIDKMIGRLKKINIHIDC
jgi:hypothetical protein